ncbi:CHAT domain-containing protein [Armillaria borealis]|uniref:CHAT domain-containing protein n=1 Tax=Armillaria borealis TaxID=47425 RepID=A0AA39JY25_9AGAR|nr:CHAT domain-containing protein [Armillaria borealis]
MLPALYNTAERGTKVYEFVASSYTPTVGILADISNQQSEEFSGLLTVCQPHTPGQNPIPKTEDEVCSVVQVAVESGSAMNVSLLGNDDATPDAVLSGMVEHSWIHLACHARQDPTQPLESAFMLAGDPKEGCPLKLTEIAKRANTNADFAFLSACQTATGDVFAIRRIGPSRRGHAHGWVPPSHRNYVGGQRQRCAYHCKDGVRIYALRWEGG